MGKSLKEIYEEQKSKVKVLILGPYGECKDKLLNVRDFLRKKGFIQTYIVEDLPNLDYIPKEIKEVYFLEKSKHYIKYWGEILIFIFTTECDCGSILRELSFLADKVIHKCNFTTILQKKDYQFPTLFRGTIKVHRISAYIFENDTQLYNMVFSACFNSLTRLRILGRL